MGRGEACAGVWLGNLSQETTGGTGVRWHDNIKTDLEEVGFWGYVLDRAGSGLGQVGALVNGVTNLRFHKMCGFF
jgi:hypothetical protein